MSSCPIKTSPLWEEATNKVGIIEAYRDFMEYNTIRDAETIERKVKIRQSFGNDINLYRNRSEEDFNTSIQLTLAANNLDITLANPVRSLLLLAYNKTPLKASFVPAMKTFLLDVFNKSNITVSDKQLNKFLESMPNSLWNYINNNYLTVGITQSTPIEKTSTENKFNFLNIGFSFSKSELRTQQEKLYTDFAEILNEPNHALHALVYGSTTEKKLDKLYNKFLETPVGQELFHEQGRDINRNYLDFVAKMFEYKSTKSNDPFLSRLNNNDTSDITGENAELYTQVIEIVNDLYDEAIEKLDSLNEAFNEMVDSTNEEEFNKQFETIAKVEQLATSPEITNEFLGTTYFNEADVDFNNYQDQFNDETLDDEQVKKVMRDNMTVETSSKAFSMELVSKMSTQLGIDYSIVSIEEATKLLGELGHQWTGQPGFFYKGRVILIDGVANTNTVFHEFSHGVIRAISKQNPEFFQRLFDRLSQTVEGQEILKDLDESDPLYREEAIVRALEAEAMYQYSKKPNTIIGKIINDLMYNIKKILRQMFGQSIAVEKLSPNTTLKELAGILVSGQKITLDSELIAEDDIVAFMTAMDDALVNDFRTLKENVINEVIDKSFITIKKTANRLLYDENYEELNKLMRDRDGKNIVSEMQSNLYNYKDSIKRQMAKFLNNEKELGNKTKALAKTMLTLEVFSNRMLMHLNAIKTNPDLTNSMQHVYYYGRIVKDWKAFLEEFSNIIDSNSTGNKVNELRHLISDIQTNIKQSEDVIAKVKANGAVEGIYKVLLPMKDSLSAKYKEILEDLKRRNAPITELNRIYKEYYGLNVEQYEDLQRIRKIDPALRTLQDVNKFNYYVELTRNGLEITKEKIDLLMHNQLGDVNYFNSFLEGYLYNTDPVVSGLALFVKNNLTDVMIVTEARVNQFAADIQQELRTLGYTNNIPYEFLKSVAFEDDVYTSIPSKENVNEREHVMMKVWTFMNAFKGYRGVYSKFVQELKVLQDEWDADLNNAEKQKAYLDKKWEFQKFKDNYMHQEYDARYYKRRALFEQSEQGRMALALRERALEKIRNLSAEDHERTHTLEETNTELENAWNEYRELSNLYQADGSLKVDSPADGVYDYSIAKILQEYAEQSKEFYENVEREGAFNVAYSSKMAELRAIEGITSEEINAEMQKWFDKNIRIVYKEDYYKYQDILYQKVDEILSLLDAVDPKLREKYDNAKRWKEINDICRIHRNEDGIIQGSTMTLEKQKKVKMLQDAIRNSPRLEKDSKVRSILGEENIKKLNAIFSELSGMSEKVSTLDYIVTLNKWMGSLDLTEFGKYFNNMSPEITRENAAMIFNKMNPVLENWLKTNAEFKEWYDNNHSKVLVPNSMGTYNEVYQPSHVWTIKRPVDTMFYESFTVTDINTGEQMQVLGLPTMTYYTRQVKDKYKTKNIPGITQDNSNRYLPKSREIMEQSDLPEAEKYIYINEEYERLKNSNDPKEIALFNLIEKMKKFHLETQAGLPIQSKLYYDVPRYMMNEQEEFQMFTSGRETIKSKIQFFTRRVRDFLSGETFGASTHSVNFDRMKQVMMTDLIDDEDSDYPIDGLYRMESKDVSGNVLQSLMRYALSAERQKKLIEMSPFVHSVQDTIASQPLKQLETMNNRMHRSGRILAKLSNQEPVRKKTIDNFIEREFYGIYHKGITADKQALKNFTNLLFKRASFSFFALNIPSALKNSFGYKFNALLETIAKNYVDFNSMTVGNTWAMQATAAMSANIYNRDAKNIFLQTVNAFDMIQDRAADKIGESLSRTIGTDVVNFTWLYSFRKLVEHQASLQLFAGVLHNHKVNQVLSNGETKLVPYLYAFELQDNVITLKKGIDIRYATKPTKITLKDGDTVESLAKEYNTTEEAVTLALRNNSIDFFMDEIKKINNDKEHAIYKIGDLSKMSDEERVMADYKINQINEKAQSKIDKLNITIDNDLFKFYKNRGQQLANDMAGNYSKFDQADAQRYLLYRWITYLRRYFTPMFLKRFGYSGSIMDPRPRFNAGLGDAQKGTYIEFFQSLGKILKSGGQHFKYMTPSEKKSWLRFVSEVGMLMIIKHLLYGLIFGYDDDDKDRFVKLRDKSGPMGFLGLTRPHADRPEFNLPGFASLHALHLMMQIRVENEQFNPFTGGLQQYNSLLDLKSVALGPTTDSFMQLLDDANKMITGDPKARYTRNIGPYEWQEHDDYKIMNHLAKMFGLTGSSIDPALGIQNLQAFQNSVKR